ncbi:hypothetical protein EZ428_05225 [Pedobacter frigiditerrae]|uniref:Uncharacterized protein n=1 Tax=Pedobacter frigiditerrae TaxID=2530452 RepID=A0A4R0N2X2_9SPHI|nr:hypothetical protein [Pedobacter frigiditerrae]TCC94181.1 hypothetical protein EZ428_05225 [Pedobacter frigiditerrae]
MRNILTLHEAIAIVLLNMSDRKATFIEIANEIENRNFYPNRKGNISLAKQIKLRSAINSSPYLNTWFEVISDTEIRLI